MIKRQEGETLEAYKARRRAAKAEEKARARSGWWLHKNGDTEQPYGELPKAQAAKGYTRQGHRRAANERAGKQIMLAWISQFLWAAKSEAA